MSHFCCVPYIVLGSSFYLCLVRGHLLAIPVRNRPNSFFLIKANHCVFELSTRLVFRVCVNFIAWLRPRLIIEFSTTDSELYCMQLIFWTLNMNYDRKNKAILYRADISKRYFSVCHLKTVFYFLHELKQRSRSSDVTRRHQRPVDSDVTEGVITTRSTRIKFRLGDFKQPVI